MPRPKSHRTPAQKLKISRPARDLIKSLENKGFSQRQIAHALRLPNNAQLSKMLRGLIGDTPAMTAAIERAKCRARKAFLLAHEPDGRLHVTAPQLRAILKRIKDDVLTLECLLSEIGESGGAPGL